MKNDETLIILLTTFHCNHRIPYFNLENIWYVRIPLFALSIIDLDDSLIKSFFTRFWFQTPIELRSNQELILKNQNSKYSSTVKVRDLIEIV